MDKIKILWADDEIDLLKPQTLFLESRGYEVVTVTNGHDAVEECSTGNDFDVVFLDESMPGINGLETLSRIKRTHPNLPVVMITKNEAETVMEEALGSQIADYLIKPVNPNQILLTLKKILDNKRLVREKTSADYQQDFRQIFLQLQEKMDSDDWAAIYQKIISWELKIDLSQSNEMADILSQQKKEANAAFGKYLSAAYPEWMKDASTGPVNSARLLREKVFPSVQSNCPTILLVLDNLRFDQWKAIEPILLESFRLQKEEHFYSILPTATQYSRNALFAGMMPAEIEKKFPDKWVGEQEEGGKNNFEADLLAAQISKVFRKDIRHEYLKITQVQGARTLQDNILNYLRNDLTVIVYNFIDMLSHARTEMEVLKELAGDEKAYRSLTRSWFANSPLCAALEKVSSRDVQLIVTTDHGTIRVNTPLRIIGDRETTTNLRYKVGKNMQYDKKNLLEIKEPHLAGLPRPHISSTYIFAREDGFFLYPNNYNHYLNYYRNTFQHGGISLEEVICPVVTLRSRAQG